MTPELINDADGKRIARWALPYAATLGSLVRTKGIFQATRLRLAPAARKALDYKASELTLDLSALPAGIYVLQGRSSEGTTVRRFVRE